MQHASTTVLRLSTKEQRLERSIDIQQVDLGKSCRAASGPLTLCATPAGFQFSQITVAFVAEIDEPVWYGSLNGQRKMDHPDRFKQKSTEGWFSCQVGWKETS